jgi:hypothetical protein
VTVRNLDRVGIVAFVAVVPVVVATALRLPLVNQLNYADAWFYSAYAWSPKHAFATAGWNYFSARFPPILAIGFFERTFGTQGGYVTLRYLLAVAAGAALYVGVRRFAGRSVALATVLLLYLDPFFSRMLLWDYAGFVAISAGVVGFALWWWSDGRKPAWTAPAGGALAVAVYANALVGTLILVLAAVEVGAAVRLGRAGIARLLARFGISITTAFAVFVMGYLGYAAFLGWFNPIDLLRPTIDFLRSNQQNAALYQRPTSQWLLHEVRIWPALVVSVALIAVLGRRVLSSDVSARVAQVCIGYTVFLWVYRVAVTSSVIETWWANSFVVIALAPGIGVLLHSVGGRRRKSVVVLLSLATVAFVAVFVRTATGPIGDVYRSIAKHPVLLFALLGVAVAAAIVLAVRRTEVTIAALVLLLAATTLMMWAPSVFDARGTTGLFVRDGRQEWRAYRAGRSLIGLVRDYDAPGRRVLTWYPGTSGLTNIGWTTLPQDGTTVQLLGVEAPLNKLKPLGKARLSQPDVAYVLIMSTRARDILAARQALASNGFGDREVKGGSWAGGRLTYALLALR